MNISMMFKIFFITVTAFTLTCSFVRSQVINAALNKQLIVSSEDNVYRGSKAVDGLKGETNSWKTITGKKAPHFIEIDLHKYHKLSSLVVYGLPGGSEKLQRELKIQYWDDANWTDLNLVPVLMNGGASVRYTIGTPVTTFMVRLQTIAADGLALEEVEVYGELIEGQALPDKTASKEKKDTATKTLKIQVLNNKAGRSLKYVGYNQGYYMPGSNVSAWVEYSSVNSLRVWTSLNEFAPEKAFIIQNEINNLEAFDNQKKIFRDNAVNSSRVNWEMLNKLYATESGGNKMVFNYALNELKKLRIDVILQINERNFEDTWQHKWLKWQQFYTLAYYAAKTGDVSMYALQNEPNHRAAGPMQLETWTRGLQIASDAIRSAVEDVNKHHHKSLKARLVAPVTAGNNTDWWAYVVGHIRDGYNGKKLNHDLFDVFSTHSYNQPAIGYQTRVSDIREVIRKNHPVNNELPIVFTETGRWMNALLIDKEETYDSPSVFSEWAGMYSNNMKNGAYGMWAFKFANTTSDVYPRGIKSGHHLTWQGKRIVEDAYVNLALGKPVYASSKGETAKYINDGDKSDTSSWQPDSSSKEKWIEVDLGSKHSLGSAVIYTGSSYGVYTGTDRVKNFRLEYLSDSGRWMEIPGSEEKNSKYVQVWLEFPKPVFTDKVRWTSTDTGKVKVREIKLFAEGDGPSASAKANYNVSGLLRTGEVVRLFAKGFKEGRDLMETKPDTTDSGLDTHTSYDPVSDNYHVWLVQRGSFNYEATVNLSAIGVYAGSPVTLETVDKNHYGEVTELNYMPANRILQLTLPPQSVQLLTIPANRKLTKKAILPAGDAMAAGGTTGLKNYSNDKELRVELDASKAENNSVTYINFKSGKEAIGKAARIVLSVHGSVSTGKTFRMHAYLIPTDHFDAKKLTWENAPLLDETEALVQDVGELAFVAGEITFDSTGRYHHIDVTDVIKRHPGVNLTFVFIRETRHPGDDEDKGRHCKISSMESANKPVLNMWMKD